MELQQILGFINTPALWDKSLLGVEQFNFPTIDIENFEPKPIPKNIRLGHQIEHMFHQLIEHSKAYEILLFNTPIRDNKRTIGEIDFILKDNKSQELIHLELSFKFYLVDEANSIVIHQLIGPNRKDSFYEKIQKVINKQFKLIHTKEAINILHDNKIKTKNIISKACFKGQLFTKYKTINTSLSPFNNNCIFGYWITLKEFSITEFRSSKYFLPIKHQWIITPHQEVDWLTFSETFAIITTQHLNQNSPMVWRKIDDSTFEKIFVVW